MKKFIIFLSLILLPLFSFPTLVFAQEVYSGQTVILSRDQTVDQDYFAAGSSITLSGTVNGDVYLAGGNVLVDGTVNGDLLVAGGNITLQGTVTGNVRSLAGNTTVSSGIGKNLSVAGGSINITDNAQIGGSLAAVAGSLQIFGPIQNGATLAGGEITLGNSIGGNVNSRVEVLTLTSGANIAGNLDYTSNTQVQTQPGATVSGAVTQHAPPARPKPQPGQLFEATLLSKLISLISYFIVGLLLLRFFTNLMVNKVDTLLKRPWASLLWGLVVLVITPIALIILFITVIGIPLALIGLAIYLIALYLSVIVTSLAIGQQALEMIGSKRVGGWALLLGLVIYGILSLIPIIGGIITFLAVLFGLGAIALTWKDYPKLLEKTSH